MESGFNPNAQNPKSTAGGLLGLTNPAIQDLQARFDGYGAINKYDPAQNIDAASQYLALRVQWAGGNVAQALAGYGTGPAYATTITNAAAGLQLNPGNPMQVLIQNIGVR